MPRSEARIFTSIWRDPHFLALEPGPQRLYMFLLSQDDLSYCGVIPLRPPRWASKAAGLTAAAIEQDLKALETDPRVFVVADWETGELLARSLLRRDEIWRQPNLLKAAREAAAQVESPRIRGALVAELRRLPLDETPSEQVKTLVADFIQDLNQGNANPSDYPHGDPDQNPTDEGDGSPDGDPNGEDHAHARGKGERNGSSETGAPFPVPLAPDPPSLPARDRKLGTRLPDDFEVTPEMVTWFRQHCPHVDGKTETEKFCDYWQAKPGKDGRKLDWVRTWKNWMRTAEDRAMPRNRASPSVPTTNARVQAGFDLAAQYAEAERNAERKGIAG
jgi:hypothetical protein